MLKLDQSVPERALLSAPRAALLHKMTGSNATWMTNSEGAFETEDRVILGWRSATNDRVARPTPPNTGHGMLAGAAGLQCRENTHCGLMVDRITENADRFTLAVIYTTARNSPAQTLVSVNTGPHDRGDLDANYLFLSDDGTSFSGKDNRNNLETSGPTQAVPGRKTLLVMTLSGAEIAVAQNLDNGTRISGASPRMGCPASLFIGCRNQRAGLQKTLGGAVIHDVLFWPDHALLIPQNAQDHGALAALRQFFIWDY